MGMDMFSSKAFTGITPILFSPSGRITGGSSFFFAERRSAASNYSNM